MVLQKRKSQKYRKALTDGQKKCKRSVKRAVKAQHISSMDLYALPLDVKKKIYRLAIIANMKDWENTHRLHMRGPLAYIGYKPTREECQVCPVTLCERTREGKDYEYIETRRLEEIWLDDSYDTDFRFNGFSYRKLLNRLSTSEDCDIFWLNTRCRCKACDCVREFKTLRQSL